MERLKKTEQAVELCYGMQVDMASHVLDRGHKDRAVKE